MHAWWTPSEGHQESCASRGWSPETTSSHYIPEEVNLFGILNSKHSVKEVTWTYQKLENPVILEVLLVVDIGLHTCYAEETVGSVYELCHILLQITKNYRDVHCTKNIPQEERTKRVIEFDPWQCWQAWRHTWGVGPGYSCRTEGR